MLKAEMEDSIDLKEPDLAEGLEMDENGESKPEPAIKRTKAKSKIKPDAKTKVKAKSPPKTKPKTKATTAKAKPKEKKAVADKSAVDAEANKRSPVKKRGEATFQKTLDATQLYLNEIGFSPLLSPQ